MKKTYSKPEIMFESFIMNTSIAAGCAVVVSNYGRNICEIEGSGPEGFELFTVQEGSGCGVNGVDGEDGLCYHVPLADMSYFNS